LTNSNPSRFAALRAEARRRIEARSRTIEKLARVSMADHRGSSDAESYCGSDADLEFEQRVFEEIIQFLDQEEQFRIVTIEDLMKLGSPMTDGSSQ
jgi:hypothetical protein